MPRQERSLEQDRGLVVEFARELRWLRERAGRPTYRELSSRAHFSTSALAEEGAFVIVSGRDKARGDAVVADIRSAGCHQARRARRPCRNSRA